MYMIAVHAARCDKKKMKFLWSAASALLFVLTVNGSQEIGDVNLCALNGLGGEETRISNGMLEVYTEYGWSAVNSFGFGGVEAQVVCAQLGFTFVANVSTISTTSRKLDHIIEHIKCNGSERSISECMLAVTENPSVTDLSLVYITCDTLHNTTNGIILFLLDNPRFMQVNYPEVNASLRTTYSMIEPSQNIYKEGCVTDICTPGGHFYMLGTASFESFFLQNIRNSDCSKLIRDDLPLVEFGFINVNNCTYKSTNKLVIGSEETFCSLTYTSVNNAFLIQPVWIWLLIMIGVRTLLYI